MTLYVCRHAEAMPVGGAVLRDADRPLTVQGEQDAALMGQVLKRIDSGVTRVLTSPLLRARQTAELIAEAFAPSPAITLMDALLPGVRHKSLYEELVAGWSGESIVAVGHQPDLSHFITYLIADAATDITLVPGSVARLSLELVSSPPEATLEWLLTPALAKAFVPQL